MVIMTLAAVDSQSEFERQNTGQLTLAARLFAWIAMSRVAQLLASSHQMTDHSGTLSLLE
jgi:hypothetical protein